MDANCTLDERNRRTGTAALASLRAARRVGFVFAGGCARCIFQVGVLATLRELAVRPALVVGVSAGAWNAAAVAAGTDERVVRYWRGFVRMPPLHFANVLREGTPFRWTALHRRLFPRYIGRHRLRRRGAPEALVVTTRLRDWTPAVHDLRTAADPFGVLLATNYLPPFYLRPPLLGGEPHLDGGLVDNAPYEVALAAGCDAVVLMVSKGESEGGIFRSPQDPDHTVPSGLADRVVVVRPRHPLPVAFAERSWPRLAAALEAGRLRAREVLLGERHAACDRSTPRASTTGRLIAAGLRAGRRARSAAARR